MLTAVSDYLGPIWVILIKGLWHNIWDWWLGGSLMLSICSTYPTGPVLQVQLQGRDDEPSPVFKSTRIPRQRVPRSLQPGPGPWQMTQVSSRQRSWCLKWVSTTEFLFWWLHFCFLAFLQPSLSVPCLASFFAVLFSTVLQRKHVCCLSEKVFSCSWPFCVCVNSSR